MVVMKGRLVLFSQGLLSPPNHNEAKGHTVAVNKSYAPFMYNDHSTVRNGSENGVKLLLCQRLYVPFLQYASVVKLISYHL